MAKKKRGRYKPFLAEEIYRMWAIQGMMSKDIAEALDMTPGAVSYHVVKLKKEFKAKRSNLMNRLGMDYARLRLKKRV